MKIKYVGPHDAVDIPSLDLTVAQGETVDVDAEVGKSLCEQGDNWRPASGKETDK